MFFHNSRHDTVYPVSRIRRMSLKAEHHEHLRAITLDDDEKVLVYSSTIEEIMASAGPVIPAAPGTYLVHADVSGDEDQPFISRTMVLAWQFNAEDCPIPVTADGPDDGVGSANRTVLLPDGEVVRPCDRSWKTFADFEEWAKAENARRREERDSQGAAV